VNTAPVALACTAAFLLACGSQPPPAADPPPPPAAPALEAVAPPPATTEPANTAPPTPEEQKAQVEAAKLAQEFAEMEAAAKAELERWTHELRDEAKTLAEASYPTARAGIQAALKSKHRKPGNPERDKQRHPVELLEFFGLKPTMSVLEYGPGEGWITEILAPVLARNGKLTITMTDPNAPRTERPTLYGRRTQLFLEKSPEVYGKVERIVIDPKKPALDREAAFDLVLVMRGMHGWHRDRLTPVWLAQIHRSLKPKGVLGIEQHRAAKDANADESTLKGYLPEQWVVDQIEAAGFRLAKKTEINANPKDTKDHPEGVWTLPPAYRLKDKDRDKYTAIGESDRMTLKFVKKD
jgi:predicted methyltransferase